MSFFLRTFGALELLTADGQQVGDAAAQRKPLLILALAGLTPGGIPRERLLHALWPDTPIRKAQASLKQHLYALRRATGDSHLISGTPRLRLGPGIRVDALELVEQVDEGRLSDAARLLTGELFEQVEGTGSEALRELVHELRRHYAPRIAMVRAAIAAREEEALLPPLGPLNAPGEGAEREVQSATRRFVHGMLTLPNGDAAAYHRAASCTHDLLEALCGAEAGGVSRARVVELAEPARALWSRSVLVQRLQGTLPGWPPDVETLEWCLNGGLRTVDPVGRVLERWVLGSGLAGLHRHRVYWQTLKILGAAAQSENDGFRLLAIASAGARDLRAALPLLLRLRARVALNDVDPTAIALAKLRLNALGDRLAVLEGVCYERFDDLTAVAPYDLILTGSLIEHLPTRQARWLVTRLLGLLGPGGQLCLSNVARGNPLGAWVRHLVGVESFERGREDLVLLLGPGAGDYQVHWESDPADQAWFASVLAPEGRSRGRVPSAA